MPSAAPTAVPNHQLDLTDPRWWHGHVDLEPLPGGGARAWRVPFGDPRFDIGLIHHGAPAGVRIVCQTTASRLTVDLRIDREAPNAVDLVIDGELLHRLPCAPETPGTPAGPTAARVTADLPGRPVTLEVWLPQFGCAGVDRLVLDGDPIPSPVASRTTRWVTHGSSITMCHQADGPFTAWPSRVATALDLELVNLAYAGQSLLDQPIARLLRDTPADLVSLCLGINVHGQVTHNARSLLPAVMGFVETVRDGHPGVPLVVVSPIATRPSRDLPNAAGLTISDIRDIVHDGVSRVIRATGDDDLHLIDGRELLGPDELDLLVDEVHPGDQGSAVIAERLVPVFTKLL